MLCNSCGKVLEGKATLCPACEAKGGEWSKTYAGVVHKPTDDGTTGPLERASKFGTSAVSDDSVKDPLEHDAIVAINKPGKQLSRGVLLLLCLMTIVLIVLFYQFGQMQGTSDAGSVRALAHSAPPLALPAVSIGEEEIRTKSIGIEQVKTEQVAVDEAKRPLESMAAISAAGAGEPISAAILAPILTPIVTPILTVTPESNPTPAPTVAPAITTEPAEIIENLVRFGAVKRYFPYSVSFSNRSRTELRIYLGQNDFDSEKISALANHDVHSSDLPPGSDVVFLVEYPSKVDNDCSFARAKSVSVIMYRTGITGFPLPGRGTSIVLTPNGETIRNAALTCSIGPDLQTAVAGILDGSGDYTQGQAVYTLNWKVKVG